MTDGISIDIRPLAVTDAPALFDELLDERIYTHIDEQPPTDLASLQERYAFLCQGAPAGLGERWLNWVIRDAHTDAPLGTLQATVDEDTRRASIAYVVFPPHWGKGIASRATSWLLEHLRDEVGVAEAQVEIHEDNARSLNLARRLGFVDVEVHREGDHDERILRRPLGN